MKVIYSWATGSFFKRFWEFFMKLRIIVIAVTTTRALAGESERKQSCQKMQQGERSRRGHYE